MGLQVPQDFLDLMDEELEISPPMQVSFLPFFSFSQGWDGPKGYPGKVGPRGDRVNSLSVCFVQSCGQDC